MPHSRSAKKALRRSEARRVYNRAVKSAVKTQVKKLQVAIDSGNAEDMQAQLRLTAKRLHKAAAKKVIHRNYAARHLSRLSRRVKAADSAGGTHDS